jgi:hypothetical protein
MKKYQEIKNTYELFVESINELDTKLQAQIKKLKQEQTNLIIEEKIKLLKSICDGEGLDYDTIKYKYIKQKEINKSSTESVFIKSSTHDENILIKTIINNNVYYYEQKENGIVYDTESNQVGLFIDNNIELSSSSSSSLN